MGWIVAGWCAVTFCTALSSVPSGILQAFRNFHGLALGTVYGSLLSLAGVASLLLLLRPEWSLLGVFLGEAFFAGFAYVKVRQRIRQPW